ncbi:hypothetical protein P280DRAFT_472669 [Massarina eburnea CBS 473.64]|uniref:Uncharacterized protein n=1 Tax=Massarina eburnea CBS 473.64 TaxID=1395130 RepID=A0A6A6RNK8_9PLEO|nr:hypothetical protein P280DRAFT_472669 [Massarina eburnea CBS 473.64]
MRFTIALVLATVSSAIAAPPAKEGGVYRELSTREPEPEPQRNGTCYEANDEGSLVKRICRRDPDPQRNGTCYEADGEGNLRKRIC